MNDQPQSTPARGSTREVIKGFLLGVLLVIACTWLLGVGLLGFARRPGLLTKVGMWSVLGFGVSQLIYMLPAILIARHRSRMGLAKGLVIAASLAFLLNASCFVLFWSGKMGRIGG